MEDTDAYRIVNAEGDGLPGLTVDRYGEYLMVQLYCAGWRPHLPVVTQVLQELLNPAGIYERCARRTPGSWKPPATRKNTVGCWSASSAPDQLTVRENGLFFLVSLERGLNTGLFLDQRANRRDLMTRAPGKKILNLFSYTGAFSVAARLRELRMSPVSMRHLPTPSGPKGTSARTGSIRSAMNSSSAIVWRCWAIWRVRQGITM